MDRSSIVEIMFNFVIGFVIGFGGYVLGWSLAYYLGITTVSPLVLIN